MTFNSFTFLLFLLIVVSVMRLKWSWRGKKVFLLLRNNLLAESKIELFQSIFHLVYHLENIGEFSRDKKFYSLGFRATQFNSIPGFDTAGHVVDFLKSLTGEKLTGGLATDTGMAID